MLNARIRPCFKLRQRAAQTVWNVPDLCRAYQWPTGLGGGGVIAIVELDGGWVQADMDAYFRSVGQPAPRITDVSVGGSNEPNKYVGQDDDADLEVALDIQVAAAAYFVATGKPAVVRMYWAANEPGGIAAAIAQAAADGCDVCSISWGADEANWLSLGQQDGKNYLELMEAAAVAATNAGMIVVAASGDNDSSDGGLTPANVDAPASCPHVLACGGTSKTPAGETVWNDNPGQTDGQGTGGGFSTYFPVQAFQTGAPKGAGRLVPDVAANADPMTGYVIWVHGSQLAGMGGTSAVAPFYAGLLAACGKKLGFMGPKFWGNQNCFNDITVGDNGAYRAGPGPDACTGIGSPNGVKIARLLEGNPASRVVIAQRRELFEGYARRVVNPTEPVGQRSAMRPLRILAQGDSWFDYPCPIGGDGVIVQLQKLLGYELLNMTNLAHYGWEVRYMLGLDERQKMIAALDSDAINFDAILFSGGGNDLVGDQFITMLQDYGAPATPQAMLDSGSVDAALALLEAQYYELIQIRDRYSPGTVIFVNCYDFPPVTGKPASALLGIGPWLRPSLVYAYGQVGNSSPSNEDMFAVVQTLLSKFSAMLAGVASDPAVKDFIVVPTQGTLDSSFNSSDWQNELHPATGGFVKIAGKFAGALGSEFPA